jgi:hypothetical protein
MNRFERTNRDGGLLRWARVSSRGKARGSVFRLEWLEDRVMMAGSPSIYVVNSTSGGDTGNDNAGTLSYVVGLANGDPNTAGSLIEFAPTVFDPGTEHAIDLQATVRLLETAGPEVIEGPGASVATVSGDRENGVFIVSAGVTATISNLTIAAGKGLRGAGINNEGKLDIAGCTFASDSATRTVSNGGTGGAIYEGAGASLAVTGSTFHGNSAAQGGGIFVVSGSVTIVNSFFDHNSASRASVIYNDDGTVKITKSAFDGNTAHGSGGALINIAGTLDAANCTFSDNKAVKTGYSPRTVPGGFLYMVGGQVSIAGSSIERNDATSGRGGGIYVGSGKLTISSSAIADNFAEAGGGIWNRGSLTIDDVRFTENRGIGDGGAIDNNGQMNILDSGFTSNSAGSSGGAISNAEAGAATISGCTVASNLAEVGGGGGISVLAGQLTLIISTVGSNSAALGGGINVHEAQLTAIDDTIADNHDVVPELAGGLNVSEGTANLYNTIVAQNSVGTGPIAIPSDIVNPGGTVTGSYNLIGIGGSGGLMNGQDGNLVGVADPGLGSLAFNGGATKTIALLAGSPAIDAGSEEISGVTVPTVDQRGALRGPAGLNAGRTIDIGAYEASSSYVVTTTDDSFAVGTLRTAVGWANVSSNANPANLSDPAPNTIVFDTDGVFGAPQTITLNQFLGTLEFSGTSVPEAIDGPGTGMVAVSGGGKVGLFDVDGGVTASLIGLTITDGFSGLGGGVNNAGTLTIDDSVLSDDSAFGGGGISNVGSVIVTGSTFDADSADDEYGGAISNAGTMSVGDSTLADNSAANGGGGISNVGMLSLTNVTIAGNTAATSGGGIIIQIGGTLTAVNVTIADNNVGMGGTGGGLAVATGSAALYNTIVAQNTSGTGRQLVPSDIEVSGTGMVSGSYNLIGTGGSGGLTNGINGNQVGVANPGLGTLADNGGPTETLALLTSSPAIDKASATISGVTVPTLDQRAAQRGLAGVNAGLLPDIGAYEASSSYLVATTADSFDVGTLRAGVGWANVSTNANPEEQSNRAPNTVFFDTQHLFSKSQSITLLAYLGTLDLTNTVTPEEVYKGGASVLTISGGQQVEVFDVFPGVTATIANLTIADGEAGGLDPDGAIGPDLRLGDGGAILNAGKLTLGNINLSDNLADRGGAIYNSSGGVLSIIGGAIENNSASDRGGGIYVAGGSVSIQGADLSSNVANEQGGGIYNLGTVSAFQADFDDNTANSAGGAVANLGRLKVRECSFSSNEAGSVGGAIFDSSSAMSSVTNSSFSNNGSEFSGGAIFVGGGALTLTGSTLDGNGSEFGGAIADFGGTLALSNCTLADNGAFEGGAIYVSASGEIDENAPDPDGVLTAVNVTIAYNNVRGDGALGGGLVVDTGGEAFLYNTIVAQNISGEGPDAPASDIDVHGDGTVSGTYNLIGTGGSGGLMGGRSGNLIGVADPGLGVLANNGGQTETIALLAGSPAIDAGGNTISGVTVPTIDQRGALRGPVGLNAGPKVDIGAYESSSSYLVSTVTDSTEVGTLRSGVQWADFSTNANPANLSKPAPNTVVFDTAGVFSTPQTITLSSLLNTIDFNGTDVPERIDGPGPGVVSVSGGGNVEVFFVSPDATAILTGLTITDGASGLGGAVFNRGTLSIDDCVLSNSTAFFGGAINNDGDLSVLDSTLVGNSAYSSSGGAINNGGSASVIDSTLTDNSAFLGGGAISTIMSLILTNVTIVGNSAGAASTGGGIEVYGGTAAFYNTIVAQNTRGTGAGAPASDINVVSPGTLSGFYNLIGTGGSGGLINGENHNQVGVANPVLGTLGNNGGLTQTIAVLPGSPAIGAGSSSIPDVTVPITDQRGVARPADRVDAGAFQDQGFVLTVVAGGSPQTTGLNTAFANPLTVLVTSLAGDPVAGGWVKFTAPSSGATAVLMGSPAQIGDNGQAAVTAVANGVAGSYFVTATTGGAVAPAAFNLTNQAVVGVTGVTVKWGIVGTDVLVVPGRAGGTLLPPGRTTDLPWLGISKLVITLSGQASLTRNNVTITSAIGFNYGPTSVTGSGETYTITLGRPIKQPDIVKVLISGTGFTAFTGVLPVLPGDFNDNGTVDYPDETGILNEILGITKPTIFGDINGDGVVNRADYMYVASVLGTKLPPVNGLTSASAGIASAGVGAGLAVVVGPTSLAIGCAGGSPQAIRSGASPFAVSAVSAPRAEVQLALRSRIRIGDSSRRQAF